MDDDAIDRASQLYDHAEQAYITGIASGAPIAELRRLARDVAEAARAWEVADNTAGSPPTNVTRYYDVPEALSTLWRELADAYDRRPH